MNLHHYHHQHENLSRNAPTATPRVKCPDLSGDLLHPRRIFVDEIKNNLFDAAVSLMNHTEAQNKTALRQQKSTERFSSIGNLTGRWTPEEAAN